jgi:GntR family transcriptional repressor for pyruvate dehydrogenase complex
VTSRPAAKAQPDTSSLRAPERGRLYEQLELSLRAYVQERGLQPGDRLPSERALAGALKVSRVSLRQATVSLEVQGLLEVRHGGGIYVRSLNVDPERLKTMLTRRRRLPDVLEAREAIECMLARLAAQRRTGAHLATIDSAVRAMASDIANGGIGEEADRRFHAAIAKAARNKLLLDVMNALEDPIHETLADHRRIAEAIRREDPRGAEAAMRKHLKVVANIRLLRWTPGEFDESADSRNGPAGRRP